MRTPEQLYRFHVVNLRAVNTALNQVNVTLRQAIDCGEEERVRSFVCLYGLLLGTWAESRLSKLVFEPNGFDDASRSQIRSHRLQLDRWLHAVEIAFRQHYQVSVNGD
jgi:hypothetical protein